MATTASLTAVAVAPHAARSTCRTPAWVASSFGASTAERGRRSRRSRLRKLHVRWGLGCAFAEGRNRVCAAERAGRQRLALFVFCHPEEAGAYRRWASMKDLLQLSRSFA